MNKTFCIDFFWNSQLFNNEKFPILTECFTYSLLLIPTVLFIIFMVPWIMFRKDKGLLKVMHIPCDRWYVLKMSCQIILLICLLLEIISEKSLIKSNLSFDQIYIMSYFGLCVTLLLICILTEIRRRKMNPICHILFLFWFSATFTYLVRFYFNLCRLVYNDDKNTLIIISISGITLLLFMVCFIFDCCPRYTSARSVFKSKNPCPEEYAPILSKLTYCWLDKYIYKWYKSELTEETSFDLRKVDKATKNTDLVEKVFLKKLKEKRIKKDERLRTNSISLINLVSELENEDSAPPFNPGWIVFKSLITIFFSEIGIAWIFKISHDCLLFTMPFFLRVLINYVKDPNNPAWQGYCLAALFIILGTVTSITENFCYFIISNIGIRVRAAIIGMVYRKTLRLSTEVRNSFTSGEIMNLMSVDAERVMQWVEYSWFFVSSPLQILITIIFLYMEIGVAVFAGLGLILVFLPLNAFIVHLTEKNSELELIWKDKRLKLLNEILNGIKVLKMYAWELCFISKVSKLRNREVVYIRNVSIGWGALSLVWDLIPFFVMLITFIVYVYSSVSNILTPERAFVSLALFNILRFPMIILPWGITDTINAYVSITRIGKFLIGEEIDMTDIYHLDKHSDERYPEEVVIEVQEGNFCWKKEEKVILKNINIEISRGKLIAVVGKVGVGKSSLLSAILGEMIKESGIIKVRGKIAYVPQEAWIQNKSLKENILFTKSYDKIFYDKVIEGCGLIPDLEQLPGQDETEIGERGINLSGGQKQRVSLARAVYQNHDVYLLDDPLSAVDAHVGQHLFEKVISNKGILKDKTRILVTHGLNWLPKVDEVIVLDSLGYISERGSFQELLNNGKEFNEFIQENTKNSFQETNNLTKDIELESIASINNCKVNEFSNKVVGTPTQLATTVKSERERNNDGYRKYNEITTSDQLDGKKLLNNVIEFDAFIQEYTKHSSQGKNNSTNDIELGYIIPERNLAINQNSFKECDHTVIGTPTKLIPDLILKRIVESKFEGQRQYSEISDTDKQSMKEFTNYDRTDSVATKDRNDDTNIGQLIDDETIMTGTVGWRTYYLYIVTRGLIVFILTILTYMMFAALQMYGNMWLEKFVDDPLIVNASKMTTQNVSNSKYSSEIIRERTNYYMKYYGLMGIGQLILISLYFVGFTIGNVNVSRKLHGLLVKSILRSPMSFFDTTPSGRILNRFSKDMDHIDHTINMNLSDVINCFFLVLSPIVIIIFVTPWFTLAIVPTILLYYFIQLFYMPSSRQARRLDSIAASPVFNHFTETLQGCSVIRAFSEQTTFQKINQTLIDRSSKFKFIQFASTRWLSLRLDLLGNILVFGAVTFSVFDRQYISASLIGLSVAYSLQITENLNWLLRQYTEMETNAVAIERVREFSMLPSEADWDKATKPSNIWPSDGNIKFVNFKLRYREGLPIVLDNINLEIKGGQKIGVVGRTGAGKSSLNLALFRLVEPAEGTIIIDDVDITTLGLHDLRRRLTILPQDPVIFCGTLKENLDPFENHTESEMIESLERAHLKQWVSSLQEGLDYDCGEGGVNLSTGQKQLLCLARAILRKSKVLILDEATASVDVETDRLVMETVRQQFSESTVIIIAHRINTILDTDNVVVLDQGKVVEYGNPQELLQRTDGIFKSLADQSS